MGALIQQNNYNTSMNSFNSKCLKKNSNHSKQISRTLSFQSAHLAFPFPEHIDLKHMMINIIMYTITIPQEELLKDFIETHILQFLRFRAIPVCKGWSNYWKPVQVNTENHLFFHFQQDDYSLHQQLENVMQRGYTTDEPRWELHVIHNQKTEDIKTYPNSRNAIIFRVDHSITDGQSLVKAFQSFLTDDMGNPLIKDKNTGLNRKYNKNPHNTDHTKKIFINKLIQFLIILISFLMAIVSTLKAPFIMAYQLFGPFDDDSPITPPYSFKSKYGLHAPGKIKLIKAPPISLIYLNLLKKAGNCTFNDLLISAFTGSIQRYFAHFKDTTNIAMPKNIRALLPYAFESNPTSNSNEIEALKNRWTFISVKLQIGHADPSTRLFKTHQCLEDIKTRNQPYVNALLFTIGRFLFSRSIIQKTTLSLLNRHSIVFSSLPTYNTRSQFCGSPVHELYVSTISLIPQVEIITYAGKIHFSIAVDSEVVKDAELIPNFFVQELVELGNSLGVETNSMQ